MRSMARCAWSACRLSGRIVTGKRRRHAWARHRLRGNRLHRPSGRPVAGETGLARPGRRPQRRPGLPAADAGRRGPDRGGPGQSAQRRLGGAGAGRRRGLREPGRHSLRERAAGIPGPALYGRQGGGRGGRRARDHPTGAVLRHRRRRSRALEVRPHQGHGRGGRARRRAHRGDPAAVAGVRPGGRLPQPLRRDGGRQPRPAPARRRRDPFPAGLCRRCRGGRGPGAGRSRLRGQDLRARRTGRVHLPRADGLHPARNRQGALPAPAALAGGRGGRPGRGPVDDRGHPAGADR